MKIIVTSHRNVFKPRWWQFRFRYQLWRMERERQALLKGLDPEVRRAYKAAEKRVEEATLFGSPHHPGFTNEK